MKIFALDCSATCASTAIISEGEVLHSNFRMTGLTHSETLMPMCEESFEKAGVSVSDIDTFAVTVGPGSFTGVRIGVATVKGLAFCDNTPCTPVSTLEAMAYNYFGESVIVLGVMDARRSQVYTATFDIEGDTVTRLTEDEAVAIDSLIERVNSYEKPVVVVGDGAELTYNTLKDKCANITLATEDKRYQVASSVAKLVFYKSPSTVSASELAPVYIRLPQAVRELKSKGALS